MTASQATTPGRRIQRDAAVSGLPRWRWLVCVPHHARSYDLDTLPTMPFAELQRRSLISERAQVAGDHYGFSTLVRAGIPAIYANGVKP